MNAKIQNIVLNFCVGLFLAGCIGVAMNMSYEDELQEQAYYCEMVGSGAWGDYKGIYKEVCEK